MCINKAHSIENRGVYVVCAAICWWVCSWNRTKLQRPAGATVPLKAISEYIIWFWGKLTKLLFLWKNVHRLNRNVYHASPVRFQDDLKSLFFPDEGPCRRTYCGRGRECVVRDVTGRAECVCQERCHSSFVPVCGSDGHFYENHCELYRTACLQRRRIYVLHSKDCFFKGKMCVPELYMLCLLYHLLL